MTSSNEVCAGEIRYMVRIAQVDGECATDCTVEDLRAIRAAGQAVHCVEIGFTDV